MLSHGGDTPHLLLLWERDPSLQDNVLIAELSMVLRSHDIFAHSTDVISWNTPGDGGFDTSLFVSALNNLFFRDV